MLQETIAFTLEPKSGWMTAGEKRFEYRWRRYEYRQRDKGRERERGRRRTRKRLEDR